MTKDEMLEAGRFRMIAFCLTNGISVPVVNVVRKADWRFDACAYYRADVITICVEKCASIGTAGRAWSYPGYHIDRTPYGVLQHELGHHVDRERSAVKGAYGGDFSTQLRAASREPKLTGYCPNDWEWFAEMFRLYVTNPSLLLAMRPATHALIGAAGFQDVEPRSWREVLADAPWRTLEMAERNTGHG